jgi:hypothetical protein
MFKVFLVPGILCMVVGLATCTLGTSVPKGQKVVRAPHYNFIPTMGPIPNETDFSMRMSAYLSNLFRASFAKAGGALRFQTAF